MLRPLHRTACLAARMKGGREGGGGGGCEWSMYNLHTSSDVKLKGRKHEIFVLQLQYSAIKIREIFNCFVILHVSNAEV